MSQKTSLMEWIHQNRRLQKEEDYFGLSILDTIIDYIWLLEAQPFQKYRGELERLCEAYHKEPSPYDIFGDRKKIEAEFRRTHNGKHLIKWQQAKCNEKDDPYRNCGMFMYLREVVTGQIVIQLERYMKARDVLVQQWEEAIDFMIERPELCDPKVLSDEFIVDTITLISRIHRKENPLANGFRSRLGKFWRDSDGRWKKEKRRRF
jgi:hypothetical protein